MDRFSQRPVRRGLIATSRGVTPLRRQDLAGLPRVLARREPTATTSACDDAEDIELDSVERSGVDLCGSASPALHRMQSLCAELAEAATEFDALARELQLVGEPATHARILRRMVDVAERKLQDPQRTAQACQQLLSLDPHNMELLDKMIAVYDAIGRHEELANLLGKAAASARTPPIRQLDYLMRLGQLAETTLADHDLACSAFERVLRIRRDHRGAVEALTRLYRALGSWHGLAAALGNLQDMVDSDEEAIAVGWERAEVLADKLDNPAAAVRVLEQLASGLAVGNSDIAARLLELYEAEYPHDRGVVDCPEHLGLLHEAAP